MGPLEYVAAVADGIAWAHQHMQLLLPMVPYGPIGVCCCCCRWLRFGPLKISSCCCRWFHVGPSAYAAVAVDGSACAHLHMLLLLLSMASYGPISFPTDAANSFVWAHWNMQLLLLMVSRGPIGICSYCC